jgi:hypothetical protein
LRILIAAKITSEDDRNSPANTALFEDEDSLPDEACGL